MLTERALIGASHALTQARYGKGHAGYLLLMVVPPNRQKPTGMQRISGDSVRQCGVIWRGV